jgi:hypothetical protein
LGDQSKQVLSELGHEQSTPPISNDTVPLIDEGTAGDPLEWETMLYGSQKDEMLAYAAHDLQ